MFHYNDPRAPRNRDLILRSDSVRGVHSPVARVSRDGLSRGIGVGFGLKEKVRKGQFLPPVVVLGRRLSTDSFVPSKIVFVGSWGVGDFGRVWRVGGMVTVSHIVWVAGRMRARKGEQFTPELLWQSASQNPHLRVVSRTLTQPLS